MECAGLVIFKCPKSVKMRVLYSLSAGMDGESQFQLALLSTIALIPEVLRSWEDCILPALAHTPVVVN